MIRPIQLAAVAALALAVPAHADPDEFKSVPDKKEVTLDPAASYLIVQTSSGSSMYSFPLTFVRRPEPADIDDYLARRRAALEKAHAKWVKKHASWERELADWNAMSKSLRASVSRPVEPVEPTDANLAFPAIEQENMVMIGPFNRFAKGSGRSIFVHRVRPGRYAFYGPVNFANAVAGTCMCMGTIEFEVKPGQIVNAGMMRLNFMDERKRAKEAGEPLPKTELEMPETLNAISWDLPEPGATLDPRLAGYAIVPADLRAAGRTPNYFGIQIDRLTPVPGVLAYDRDTIIDEKTGDRLR